MARESNQALQDRWQSRINRALERRDEWEKQFRVKMGRDYFAGRQNPGWPDQEWITINKIYSHMKSRLPLLYNVDPYFYVKVKRSHRPNPMAVILFEQRAKIRQSYLNYLKGELDLKTRARLAIQDAHFAYGVLKTHYSADEIDNEQAGEPILGNDGEPLLDEAGEPLLEPEVLPINERYSWSRVHPDDFLWDEDAGPLADSWKWVAERIRLTPEQAKKDKRLSRSALATAPTQTKDEEGKDEKRGFFRSLWPRGEDDKGRQPVHIGWEIYDLEAEQWLMIMEGAEKPVIAPDRLPPGVEDDPYSILRFTLVDDSPYPIPPISQGIDPQKELNLTRSRMLRHRKRFNRKYEVMRGGIDEDEITKLEVGDDGTVLLVNQLGSINAIKDAPLDQATTVQEIALLNGDLVEMLGKSDEPSLARADSATQAALLDKRLEVREGDELSVVIDWIRDAAGKMDQLVQTHISRDEAVRIVGPSGDFWELVRPDDYEAIEGEFEYGVNVGSTIPRLPQIERAQWLAFIQILGQFPHIMTRKRFMKHMAELHHIEDEAMLEELFELGQQILGGQVPYPGGGGSQSGVPQDNPIAAVLGSAMGDRGGVTNGGGAPGMQ